jgi:hypothetical protein
MALSSEINPLPQSDRAQASRGKAVRVIIGNYSAKNGSNRSALSKSTCIRQQSLRRRMQTNPRRQQARLGFHSNEARTAK